MDKNINIKISVVIPVYNESDNIVNNLQIVYDFLQNHFNSFEILVIDDGSKDETAILVERFGKNIEQIKLIRNTHKGKGYAVWVGINNAKGEYICMCDADLATPIEELLFFIDFLEKSDFSIAIASRALKEASRIGEPFYRNLMGRVFNLLVQIIALPGVKDSQCGFKVFKQDVAKDIFKLLRIYGSNSKDISSSFFGAFDVEVLYIAKKRGFKFKEIPVKWQFVKTSRLNVLYNTFFMFKDVIRIKLNDWKGYYN